MAETKDKNCEKLGANEQQIIVLNDIEYKQSAWRIKPYNLKFNGLPILLNSAYFLSKKRH